MSKLLRPEMYTPEQAGSIPEHTIDVDLLPEVPVVLDVGCRDFAFCRGILALRPEARIVAMDPDPKVRRPEDLPIGFLNSALVALPVNHKAWYRECGGLANCIIGGSERGAIEVDAHTIQEIVTGWGYFDLIKFDIECSEFSILENWPGPIATQLSIEFHDYQDRNRWNNAYFERLFAGPLKDYRVVQHELFSLAAVNPLGHWDDLLVLK